MNLDYDVPQRNATTTEDTKEICEDLEEVLCGCSFFPESADSCVTSVQFVGANLCC